MTTERDGESRRLARESVGTLAAISVALIWGMSFVAARVVLETLTPILLATLRFTLASLVFAPLIIQESRNGSVLDGRDLRELTLLGFMSVSIYFWLQYTGVRYAGAGVSALLVVGSVPILTGIVSSFLLREGMGAGKILGVALGLLGVALITVPGLFVDEVDWNFYVGVLCLLGNAICWSLYSTLSRRLMKRVGRPALVTAYVTLFGAVGLLPLSLFSDWSLVGSLDSAQWANVLYLSLVCSVLGYFLWNFALLRLEAVKAAVWLYLEPVAAFVGEALVFGVFPGPATLGGSVVVLAGALLVNRSKT